MRIFKFLCLFALIAVLVLTSGCTEPGELRTESHSVDLGDAKSVHALVRMGAGNLELSGGSEQLLNSTFTYNADALRPEIEYEVTDESGRLVVRQRDVSESITRREFRNEWKLRFNNDVPLLLSIEFGAGDGNLELGSLNLTEVDLQMGAGDVQMNLSGSQALTRLSLEMGVGDAVVDLRGDWGQDLDARIEGGVGALTLRLPETSGVRIKVKGGLGEIKAGDLVQDGDAYVNEAYGSSDVTLDIEVEGGVGEVFLETG
ncbi:hypothetical protein EO95_03850 [Methanosarcina sp. 1.H.T.1A.1]|uniref:toast rack family protein n=1 Tax=Methanosarcina sp. 1.H.T.1A.1 TaxID=1483602 RepID=UPI000621899C|nr:toast rack family protein [Methanosarcina sp. 1.H.T.1A.1]KKH96890.1 hypothetical protein EO95_03850 [Methanosarcina sp. 1.H.T.1A.1]